MKESVRFSRFKSTNITQITFVVTCCYRTSLKPKVKSTFFQDIQALPVKPAFSRIFHLTVIFKAFLFVYWHCPSYPRQTRWDAFVSGDRESFPRRLSLGGERSKVSAGQDTIFPHSHVQLASSWATEYLSLSHQLCVVQMGWRREETICLIIATRFMSFLIPALRVASFFSTAPLAHFRPSGLKAPSPAPLTSEVLPPLPLLVKWSGSFPQMSWQPPTVPPGEGCAPSPSEVTSPVT